jgi:hypothetical protein
MKKIVICVIPTTGNKYRIVLPVDDSVYDICEFAENWVEYNLNLKRVDFWEIEGM